MTFREDFAVFWGGVLGMVLFAVGWAYVFRYTWDRWATMTTVGAVVYIGLYAVLHGLP